MSLEIRQLLLDGLGGTWMILNLVTFGAQLVVDVLFIFRSPLLQAAASWSVLLFFFKILSFARGFSRLGPLVRMIMKVRPPPAKRYGGCSQPCY